MSDEWHGDTSITWGIALRGRIRPADRPDREQVRARLRELAGRHPDLGLPDELTTGWDLAQLASTPFPETGPAVRVALERDAVVVAAHHHAVDGLGLLAVFSELSGIEVVSSARGLGERPSRPFVRAAAGRVAEALLQPPAIVSPTGDRKGLDVLAARELDEPVRTGRLVAAATAAVRAWNTAQGARADRIAVAVGASLRPGAGARPEEASAYIRLRRAERLDADAVDAALRSQPAEPPAPGGGSGTLARVTGWFSRRLGSTLLVSHLGELDARQLDAVEFYPVSGGRSGVSLGAATVGGRTTLTLRARGGEQTREELDCLLGLVREALEPNP